MDPGEQDNIVREALEHHRGRRAFVRFVHQRVPSLVRGQGGGRVPLPDNATVVVVGGGPAGSFFAIHLLRKARQAGKTVNVVILEKKTEICFYQPEPFCSYEGCNYCAGGVSPRLVDGLHSENITVPPEVIESTPAEIVVHGDWKSIQLSVPEGREMMSVFRGSRPRQRAGRYVNFDTWLLHLAGEMGAKVVMAEVNGIHYSDEGRPVISYRPNAEARDDRPETTIEADFAVLAGGVNRKPGMDVRDDPVLAALEKMVPRLRPPRVRRAVIAEMIDEKEHLRELEGEAHFMQYGSKDLHIEMASMVPKKDWITTSLVGKSIDRSESLSCTRLAERFVELPHIRRLLPHDAELSTRCCCHPNMTVGATKHPYGNRLALTGDIAVARLYKDGLFSAYTTSSALADCIFDEGIDEATLAWRYAPAVHWFDADNRFGRRIFWLSHWVLSRPSLSRMLYLAVITERMYVPEAKRRLGPILWQVASGDDSYRHIFWRMLHPASLWTILRRGVLLTIRDVITERLFGLDWTGIGRYATGVPLEQMERTRREVFAVAGLELPAPDSRLHMERMFTIRMPASKQAILRQLGAFGDPDRQYLKPRFVRIQRVAGAPNQLGTKIRYSIPLARLSFSVALEKVVPERYLLYRIVEGMGKGGILAFELDELRPGINLLTIFVGFDFPRGQGLGRIGWSIWRWVFPQFAHDVVWNHSLCQMRRLAELDEG